MWFAQRGQLGIARLIDLRTPDECDAAPAVVPEGAEYHRIPTIDSTMNAPLTRPETASIVEGYETLLRESLSQQAEALAAIADAPGPVVFFCAAGKDRTGLLAALLLGLVGVDDDVIAADYALSGEVIGSIRARIAQERPDLAARWDRAAADVMSAAPESMRATLDRLRVRWGGFAGYAAAAGVDVGVVDRLRTKLVHTL